MKTGKPTKLIQLINKLLLEINDSEKGNIQLQIGKEVTTLNFVTDDLSLVAFYQKLTQLAVRDYLNPDFKGDSKSQMEFLLIKLDDCLVHVV